MFREIAAGAAIALALCAGASADDQEIDRVFVIGDSLSDGGAYSSAVQAAQFAAGGPSAVVPIQYRFLDNAPDGSSSVYAEFVAEMLGLGLAPNVITAVPNAGASETPVGGGNYAQGGSRVTSPFGPGFDPDNGITTLPLTAQIDRLLDANPTLDGDDLVILWGGANDVADPGRRGGGCGDHACGGERRDGGRGRRVRRAGGAGEGGRRDEGDRPHRARHRRDAAWRRLQRGLARRGGALHGVVADLQRPNDLRLERPGRGHRHRPAVLRRSSRPGALRLHGAERRDHPRLSRQFAVLPAGRTRGGAGFRGAGVRRRRAPHHRRPRGGRRSGVLDHPGRRSAPRDDGRADERAARAWPFSGGSAASQRA